jgi:ribose 5-phosphate isomerase A
VTELEERTQAKREAGFTAVDQYVRPGMLLGLGTGSTAVWAIRRVGELLASGALSEISAVATSDASAAQAREAGVPLTTLDQHPRLSVTIDGADEVAPNLDLIKGGGGAHLREKIVAQASDRLIIVVDETKLVPALGTTFAVPVEVITMATRPEREYLEFLGATVSLRTAAGGGPFVTDEGNRILDAAFGPIDDPVGLLHQLQGRAGIVEVGLFVGLTTVVVVAGPNGVRELTPES